jgi:hypothetical protein
MRAEGVANADDAADEQESDGHESGRANGGNR